MFINLDRQGMGFRGQPRGRLSLLGRGGRVRVLSTPTNSRAEPLTSALSPSKGERRKTPERRQPLEAAKCPILFRFVSDFQNNFPARVTSGDLFLRFRRFRERERLRDNYFDFLFVDQFANLSELIRSRLDA
jgi:hypothetical protein